MNFKKSAMSAAVLLSTVAITSTVAAQQQKPAAPATPAAPAIPVAPPAWTVTPNTARSTVEISATAKGGSPQFSGGCSKSAGPGFIGVFSGYQGGGLRTDGQMEHVSFFIRGGEWQELYSVRLQYSPVSQSWEIIKPLPPVFLNSFSRGATLAVVNSANQEIFAFDLTGSTAAVKAMRTVCGIPVGRI